MLGSENKNAVISEKSSKSSQVFQRVRSPVRRSTLPSLVGRHPDTISWSHEGFQPDLLPSPTEEEPPPFQGEIHSCVHHDSNAELWKATLERAMKGIVSIKSTNLRTFDQFVAGGYSATGFVVDRTKGVILSNRHVVTSGPTDAVALFSKYEELKISPIYFDPVHDFGFYKYNPGDIKYAEIEEIELCPSAAKVGMEIKICGNDAGEHRSILGSTLARLDRPAPYNLDFNTFYYQAASGTSGGSSGSPVLDIHGRAVALNVGGSTISTSSFYLPLHRVVRAFQLIQEGKSVPRGTLQTEFVYVPYDELKKLGLPDDHEREIRKRNENTTGLLTVGAVLPEGPGSGNFEVGDIVLKCRHPRFGERFIENFLQLWEIIDETIGDEITFTVVRSREEKEVNVTVQDVNEIIPDTFLEIGQAIIHPISYQIARLFNIPCRGIFVALSGMFNINPHFILRELDDKEVNSLDDLVEIFLSIPDGKRVSMRYRRGWDEIFDVLDVDHHFFPMALFKRRQGTWERTVLKPQLHFEAEVKALDVEIENTWQARLKAALVKVRCRTPYPLQGYTSQTASGLGWLVAVDPIPMIVVPRSIVPLDTCDVWIEIGDRLFPGRVLYLGVISVVTVTGTIPKMQPLPISTKEFFAGDKVDVFTMDLSKQVSQKATEIKEIAAAISGPFSPPRLRLTNIEALFVLEVPSGEDGVLLDSEDKSVIALWVSMTGFDYNRCIRPIIETLQSGREYENRDCGWHFSRMSLSDALQVGLSEERAVQISKLAKELRVVPNPCYVAGKLRPSAQRFKIGDVILEIDGHPVVRMRDIQQLPQKGSAQVLVLRNRQETLIDFEPYKLPSDLSARVIFWAGAYLHETHDPVLEQISPEFDQMAEKEGIEDIGKCVYVAAIMEGSPASVSLTELRWILEVDGHKVRNLEDMLKVIGLLKGQTRYLTVKMASSYGFTSVHSVKPDPKFWSAWTLEHKDRKWVRTELD